MTAFDKQTFENKIINLFGHKEKITSKYLSQKLSYFEMLHLIVFRGNFNSFEIVNLDFKQEIEFNDGHVRSLLPYFELVRSNND